MTACTEAATDGGGLSNADYAAARIAARLTSLSTYGSNGLKLLSNRPRRLCAVSSYPLASGQVRRGSSTLLGISATLSGTRNPKFGSCRIGAPDRLPSSAARNSARVCAIAIREPTPYAPPDQPVLTSQQSAP